MKPTSLGRRLCGIFCIAAALAACTKSADEVQRSAAAHLAAAEPRSAMVELKDLLQREPQLGEARLMLGTALLVLGDYVGAESELRRAAELGVDKDRLAAMLARTLLYQGKLEPVLGEPLLTGLSVARVDAEVRSLKGEAMIALGQLEEAEATLRGAAELEPAYGRPRAVLAILRLQQGRTAEAEEMLRAAAAADPRSAEVQRALGAVYANSKDWRRAESAFSKAVELAGAPPADRETQYSAAAARVDVLLSAQRVDDAKLALERLDALGERRLNTLLRARIDLAENRAGDARQALETLLAGGQSDPQASLLLAIVHLRQGNAGQAEASLRSVLKTAPDDYMARQLLAEIRMRDGKPGEAVEALKPILDQATGSIVTLAVQASVAAGDRAGAISMLERRAGRAAADGAEAADLARGFLSIDEPGRALAALESAPAGGKDSVTLEGLRLTALMMRNDLPGARTAAGELAKRHAEDPRMQVMLGDFYARIGDVSQARAAFGRARKAASQDVSIAVRAALLDAAAGDTKSAEASLAELARSSPKEVAPHQALAELKARRGDLPGALESITAAQALRPNDTGLMLAASRLKLASGDAAAAVTGSAAAMAVAPTDIAVLKVHVANLVAAKRGAEARTAIDRALGERPQDVELLLLRATSLESLDDTAGAIKAAEEAVRVQPRSEQALAILGRLQIRGDRLPEARETISRVRTVQAAGPIAPLLEAELALKERRYSSAADSLAEAGRVAPSPDLAVREFMVRREARLPSPERPLERWLERRPDDVNVRLALGDYHLSKDDLQGARRTYQRALTAQPDSVIALNNLAWIEAKQGNRKIGLELAERAHKLAPDAPAVMDTYGWLLTENGLHARAVTVLESARARPGAVPDIDYHYALALFRLDRREEARRVLDALLLKQAAFQTRAEAVKLRSELGG